MKRGTLGVLILVVAFTVMSSGCATLLSGTSQNVTINSNPPGAHVKIGYQSGITPITLSASAPSVTSAGSKRASAYSPADAAIGSWTACWR